MKSLKRFWETSPPEYKDYLFIYSWGAIWALVYFFFIPVSTLNVMNRVGVGLWAAVTIAGGVLAVAGLLRQDNLLLERLGVNLLMVGPLAYAVTQLGLLVFLQSVPDLGVDATARIHLIFFALWPYLFLNKRRRQLKNRVRLVKKIPLLDEMDNG